MAFSSGRTVGRGARSDRSAFNTYIAECETRFPVSLPGGATVVMANQWCTPDGVVAVIQFMYPQAWAAARLLLSAVQAPGDDLRFTIRPIGVNILDIDAVIRCAVVDYLDSKFNPPIHRISAPVEDDFNMAPRQLFPPGFTTPAPGSKRDRQETLPVGVMSAAETQLAEHPVFENRLLMD